MRTSTNARAVALVAIVAYVAFYSFVTINNHNGYATYGFDFGIYDQGMWLLSRFEDPFITIMGRHLFGDHTSFILVPFVPLYWLFPRAEVLLILQSLALGIAAWPVFLVARDLLRDERLAAPIAVGFLLQPALGWTNFEQFHPDVFEVPLLMFMLWFMIRRRWVPYFVFLGLLLLVKEDVALLTFVLGIYVAVRYSAKVGIATSVVSALFFVFAVFVVLRHFNEVGTLNAWRIPFGGPGGLIEAVFTQPGEVAQYVVSDDRPLYVLQLLAPFALLPLLAPEVLVVAIGPLASNVMSTFWYQYHIEYHYGTLILPVLALASIVGISRFKAARVRRTLAVALLVAAMVGTFFWGPLPGSRKPGPIVDTSHPSFEFISEAVSLVPEDAVVAAHYRYVTHLDHRSLIYEFPTPFAARNWGVGDEDGQRLPEADTVEYLMVPESLGPDAGIFGEIRDEFRVVYDQGGVLLLVRAS
ncbi:MAG: DUF2079 domain-containing protein [Acidimicrobiia bacterium]